MIYYKKGNILDEAMTGRYEVILHGCNCFCSMTDGLAQYIAQKFPEALQVDKTTKPGDETKLGTYTSTPIIRDKVSFILVNCYTQYRFAGMDLEEVQCFDYNAFEKVLYKIKNDFHGKKIAMPLIGTGHAMGDLNKVISIIHNILEEENVDIILFSDRHIPLPAKSIKNIFIPFLRFLNLD